MSEEQDVVLKHFLLREKTTDIELDGETFQVQDLPEMLQELCKAYDGLNNARLAAGAEIRRLLDEYAAAKSNTAEEQE